MALKDIFINALVVYKKNFGKLFLPLLVLQLAVLLPLMFFTMPGTVNAAKALLVTISSFSRTGEGSSSVFYVFVFILLVLIFLSPLIVSNTVYVVDKDYQGKTVDSFRQSFGFSRRNYGNMIKSYFAGILLAMPVIFIIFLLLSGMFMRGFDIGALSGADTVSIVISVVLVLLYVLGTVFIPYTVVAEKKSGFSAVYSSFKYIYRGNFLGTLGKLALAAALIGALMAFINWLSQLPFAELFYLYLRDPLAALQQPLMIFAIVLSLIAIFVVALIIPFWYAFSYNTYQGAKLYYEERTGSVEQEP